jgi:hypothetical protein
MNKIRTLLAIPFALLGLAGAAHALDYVYPDGEVTSKPVPNPAPMPVVSSELRNNDLQLGNCLKANGGRMAPRCAELRDRSDRLAAESHAPGHDMPINDMSSNSTTTTTTDSH